MAKSIPILTDRSCEWLSEILLTRQAMLLVFESFSLIYFVIKRFEIFAVRYSSLKACVNT